MVLSAECKFTVTDAGPYFVARKRATVMGSGENQPLWPCRAGWAWSRTNSSSHVGSRRLAPIRSARFKPVKRLRIRWPSLARD